MPKISIILPVYNVESYLDETIQSLLEQTFTDFEVIAVNDGSTDNSETILKKYQQQDSRVSYYNQSNQGQSAARNHALNHATGDYIYFMDSDDKADLDLLRLCYDYAQQTQADFIFFDGELFYEEGVKPVAWNYKRSHLLQEDSRYDGETLLNMMLDNRKHTCVVWLLFVRKAYLDRIGLRFYEGIIHEDELFTTILTLSSNNIFCLKQSLVAHRIRTASTMGISYSKRNINCYLTVADELLRFSKAPIIHKFLRYTLSKVFYTGHQIPLNEKPKLFWRAVRSGFLKYIGWKSTIVFWLKS
jgi:glycosyltransferase involved in cell wall biosynthesis